MGEPLTGRGPLRRVPAEVVRATIGRAFHHDTTPVAAGRIGEITLLPVQRDGAVRAERALERWRGVLLCDQPGSGKTYTALAVAAHRGGTTVVVAPAALRRMWRNAAHAAGVAVRVVGTEAIGRGHAVPPGDLLIVDEAHHLRNPHTRRYRAVASACRTMPVLLVTATPVHNRREDLVALLALFLGDRARALTDAELPALVLRRPAAEVPTGGAPVVHPTRWVRVRAPEWPLAALMRLPPPVPAADGATARALVLHALLREWASSDAALVGALRRRIGRGVALRAALESGRYPTRRELRAWTCGDDAVQLAFPELIASASPSANIRDTCTSLQAHVTALRALLDRVRREWPTDPWRIERVRALRRAHAGARVVAFTTYADTARMLYRALRHDGGVALLTASGGEVAGGRVTRAELLAHFDPRHRAARGPACDAVTFLVSTDLASEGVDLHEASVVIHLDLPWTGARLAQRVGRVARFGSPHRAVDVVGFRPCPAVERVLRATTILRRKGRITDRTIGGSAPHTGNNERHTASDVVRAERIRAMVARWRADATPSFDEPVWGVIAASRPGALACYVTDGEPRLVAWDGRGVATDAARSVERLVSEVSRTGITHGSTSPAAADGDAATDALLGLALDRLRAWQERQCARRDAGVVERRPRGRHAPADPPRATSAPLWAVPDPVGSVRAARGGTDPPATQLIALLVVAGSDPSGDT